MVASEKEAHRARGAGRGDPRRAILFDLGRYALTSVLSLGMILGLSATLHELVGLTETLAVGLALAGAFLVNFTLLRRFVFPGQMAPPMRQLLETAATSIGFRAFEYGVFLALNLGAGVDYLLATAAAVCVSALGKFTVYRQVVFNRARQDGAREL